MLDNHDIVAQRYVVQRLLGQGGMGAVYLAEDTERGQQVALKVVLLAGEAYRRFQREFRLMTRLAHPNIVRVFDSGTHEDRPFMVMEYLNCHTLEADWSTPVDTPERFQERLQVLIQLAKALAFIHTQGVIHRDLKPENVMLLEGQAKLMDFGLAKSTRQSTAELTRMGTIMGTASYMSPEQAKGQAIDARSDLYAFGCMIFWAMTGSPPFTASNFPGVLIKHLNMPPPELSSHNPLASEELSELVVRLMAKAPEDRPSDANEVALKLTEISQQDQGSAFKTVVIGDTVYEDYTPQKLLHPPLVGHGLVLGQLHEGLRALQDGRGSRFVIHASTGLGLSRVLEELHVAARAADCLVMKLNCHSGVTIPFEIWKEGLQQLERRNPESFEHSLGDLQMILAPLLGRASLSEEIPADVARLRLYQAVDQLLAKLSQEHGLLILLDDVHEADETTLGLLAFLVRGDTAERAMLAVGLQQTDDQLMRQTLQGFAGQQLKLNPLSHQESLELINEFLGGEVEQPLQRYVADRAQGNPLFISEVLKSLLKEGHISKRLGLWHWSAQDIEVPGSIEEILLEQLTQLSTRAYKSFQAASAIGVQFDFDLWLELLNADEDALLDDTDELLKYALIQELPRDNFRFSSPLMRTLVHQSLNPRRRRRYHQQLADMLSSVAGTPAAVLADHLAESSQPERALSYALQAADEAFAAFANDIAETYYRLALQLAEKPSDVLSTKLRLGKLLDRIGRWEEAEQLFKDAAQADTLATALHHWGKLKQKQGQLEESKTLLAQAISIDEYQLEAHCDLGHSHRLNGNFHLADQQFRQALELAEGADIANIQADVGQLNYEQGDYESARSCLELALENLQAYPDRFIQAKVFHRMGIVEYRRDKFENALEYYQKAQDIYQTFGDQERLLSLWQDKALVYTAKGDLNDALTLYQNVSISAYRIGDSKNLANAEANQGRLLCMLNDIDKALPLFENARQFYRQSKMIFPELTTCLFIAEAKIKMRAFEDARLLLQEAQNILDHNPHQEYEAYLHYNLFEIEARQGNLSAASQHVDKAIQRFQAINDVPGILECHLGYTMIAIAQYSDEVVHEKFHKILAYTEKVKDKADTSMITLKLNYLQAVQRNDVNDISKYKALLLKNDDLEFVSLTESVIS